METFAPSPVQLVSVGEYCVWRSNGEPFSVCFRREAMARLDEEVVEGYRSLPKRGAEVGGILLGRVDRQAKSIVVEDIEPIPCEHVTGPAYALSEADRRNWGTTRQQQG